MVVAIALVFTTMYFDILVGGSQSMPPRCFVLMYGLFALGVVLTTLYRRRRPEVHALIGLTGVTLRDWTAKGPVPLARAPAVRCETTTFASVRLRQPESAPAAPGDLGVLFDRIAAHEDPNKYQPPDHPNTSPNCRARPLPVRGRRIHTSRPAKSSRHHVIQRPGHAPLDRHAHSRDGVTLIGCCGLNQPWVLAPPRRFRGQRPIRCDGDLRARLTGRRHRARRGPAGSRLGSLRPKDCGAPPSRGIRVAALRLSPVIKPARYDERANRDRVLASRSQPIGCNLPPFLAGHPLRARQRVIA